MTFQFPIDIPTSSPIKMHIVEMNILDPELAIHAPSLFCRGWGNGYLRLPPNHKYFGADFIDIPYTCPGGLTCSRFEDWDILYWVIGFDTAHAWDTPAMDEAFVREQTLALQQQAIPDLLPVLK